MKARSVLVCLLVLGSARGAHAAMDVTQCGVAVPPRETAVLRNTIVCENRCSNDPSILCHNDDELCPDFGRCLAETITLGPGSRLELGGFQILMAYQGSGVVCGDLSDRGRCTIVGPGDIVGGKGTGVLSPAMDLRLKSVVIDNTDDAVVGGGFVTLEDVRVGGREDQISAVKGSARAASTSGPQASSRSATSSSKGSSSTATPDRFPRTDRSAAAT
jgi:hypothetical protein